MARLHIYVNDKGGKTVSKFGKPRDNDKIVFHNQHPSNTLTVTIEGEPEAGIALCKGSQEITSFTVTPADPGQKKAFSICSDYRGETFKYTATIAGSEPEDPIIIIERSNFFNVYGTAVLFVGVAALAFAAGTLFGMRRARSSTGTQA